MKNVKKMLVMLCIVLGSGIYSASAQIYVKVRPVVPVVARVERPSPRHVWIDEEWEPRGGAYVFVGGHWAEPPRPHAMWVPGHWRATRRGDMWVPGHWR